MLLSVRDAIPYHILRQSKKTKPKVRKRQLSVTILKLFRMKKLSLFAMAFAAFAFAACTDDDKVGNGENPDGPKGELVDAISINFGESKVATRAKAGKEKGEGTEGMIYEAFIFAKEANPSHTRAKTGDYTVIRVTADPATGALIAETGGVDEEKYAKDALTKAINESSTADVEWLVENVATFHGVRQGDYVYVIANDPSLTLAQASEKAHQGEASEENIKGYVASINKDYLNGLVYRPEYKITGAESENELPKGRFFMAGREMIPVSPTIPSNGTFALQIGLDRELAKVNFMASVSTSTSDAACGNVVFKEDDGIVVARIARKASPFVDQESGDWYVPANTNKENWPINSHALVNGIYSSYCDGTMEGSRVFDGTKATAITDWVSGATIPANFNAAAPTADITEYRYSWKINNETTGDVKDPKNYVYVKSGTMYSPMFYTTPNYSNNTNSVTVICTQATYVGRGVFSLSDMADKYVDAALANTGDSITIYTKEELAALESAGNTVHNSFKAADNKVVRGLSLPNPLTNKSNSAGDGWVADNIVAKLKNVIDSLGVSLMDKDDYPATAPTTGALAGIDYDTYVKMMNRFYLAVMLQQRLDNKNTPVLGTMEDNTSIVKYGNGITKDSKVFLANKELQVTDSLMIGVTTVESKRIAKPFFIDLAADRAVTITNFVKTVTGSGANVENLGSATRKTFFAKVDAYEYFKGQKVYYRADVADYVGGVSNKLTERNTYYNTSGTIQSLGAKSIHDAIYSDNNAMSIVVKVNDWSLSINSVPM